MLKNKVRIKLGKLVQKLDKRYNGLIEIANYFNEHYSDSKIIDLPQGTKKLN